MGLRAIRFTDWQISKEEVVVRHIGKDAIVLYDFKAGRHRRPRIIY